MRAVRHTDNGIEVVDVAQPDAVAVGNGAPALGHLPRRAAVALAAWHQRPDRDGRAVVEVTRDLVPERHGHGSPREHVEIRTADAGAAHVHANATVVRIGPRHVDDLDPVVGMPHRPHRFAP